MKLSRRRVGLLILVVIAGGIALANFAGTLWQDESLDSLLSQLRSPWATTRRIAANELARFSADSEKVVPVLLGALSDSDGEVRKNSLESLAFFGEKARPVGPELRRLLKEDQDEDVRRRATTILGVINDSESIPALIEAMDDRNPEIQAEATRSLGRYGVEASSKQTIDKLLSFLGRERPEELRDASLDALDSFAKDDQRVFRAIAEVATKDESFQVRKKAITLLMPKFDFVVPTLVAAIDDPNPQVQLAAGTKLAWIGIADDRTVPALCHAALKADKVTSEGVAMNLNTLILDRPGEKTPPEQESNRFRQAVQELRKVLETRGAAAHEQVVNVLGRIIGSYEKSGKPGLLEPARAAVEALLGRMEDEQEQLALRLYAMDQWSVIQMMAAHGVSSRTASATTTGRPMPKDELHATALWIKSLGKLLKSPVTPVRSRALEILADSFKDVGNDPSFRQAWHGLAPTIAEVMKSDDSKARKAALQLLNSLGPEAVEALPILQSSARDAKDPAVRTDIELTIRSISSADELKNKNPEVQVAAAATLAGLGWRATTALPALISALKDPEPRVRTAAARALGALGAMSTSAVEPLDAMLTSEPDPAVRLATLEALEAIAPGTSRTIEAHLKSLHDPDPKVRESAATFQRVPAADTLSRGLAAALTDPSEAVASAAATSLMGVLFQTPETVTALLKALGDERLRKIVGPALDEHLESTSVSDDFGGLRKDPDAVKRTIAAAIPAIRDALAIKDQDVDSRAYGILGRIVESSRVMRDESLRQAIDPAFELYLQGLDATSPSLRQEIIGRLGGIRLRRGDIASALIKHLDRANQSTNERQATVRAIADQAASGDADPRLHEVLKPAVPILIKAIEDPNMEQQIAAIRALGQMGENARSAEDALNRVAKKDPRLNVRTLAENAIKAIQGLVKMPPATPKAVGKGLAF